MQWATPLFHSCLYEFLVEYPACVLVASVTVEQRMCVRVGLNGPVKGFEYKRIVVALTDRIGHDASVTEVQDCAQIEFMDIYPLIPSELRHICKPLLIGFVSIKLAVQQVFSNVLGIPARLVQP